MRRYNEDDDEKDEAESGSEWETDEDGEEGEVGEAGEEVASWAGAVAEIEAELARVQAAGLVEPQEEAGEEGEAGADFYTRVETSLCESDGDREEGEAGEEADEAWTARHVARLAGAMPRPPPRRATRVRGAATSGVEEVDCPDRSTLSHRASAS